MSEKEKAPKTRAEFLRDAFEGMKGHQPKSDDELNQWLAMDCAVAESGRRHAVAIASGAGQITKAKPVPPP